MPWSVARVLTRFTERLAANRANGTEPFRLPEPEEREAYRVLNFAMRVGEILIGGGAGTTDVETTILEVTRAWGLRQCETDVTFTSITLSYIRGSDLAPLTLVRVVRRRSLDYTRLTEVHNLVRELVSGDVDRERALERLTEIDHARHPYSRWLVTLGWAGMAAAVGVLLGGDFFVAATAFAATAVLDRANRLLAVRNVPPFYQYLLGGAVATGMAALLYGVHASTNPSLVVAAGITVLLSGLALVGSVQDAIGGYFLTATGRGLEVFLFTGAIISGVALTLSLAGTVGVPMRLSEVSPPLLYAPIQVAAAGVAAACFGVANYTPLKIIAPAGVAGMLGSIAYLSLSEFGLSLTLAAAVAGVFVGLGSYVLADRQKAPPLLYLVPGITPLLPGLTVYRGMSQLTNGESSIGLTTLFTALSIGVALAAGVILGQIIAQPVRREFGRRERRFAGPRLVAPAPEVETPQAAEDERPEAPEEDVMRPSPDGAGSVERDERPAEVDEDGPAGSETDGR